MSQRFGLRGVTPWGRRAFEYEAYFDLSSDGLSGTVLDCGAGPSSFSAEMAQRDVRVTALDPIYGSTASALRADLASAEQRIRNALATEHDRFVWHFYGDIEQLMTTCHQAAKIFFTDFARGRTTGRYICGELPRLPFPTSCFDLALCSHLLFLYDQELDLKFHLDALSELTRVATEVRVFPLISLDGTPSPFVQDSCTFLEQLGLDVSLVPVPFEFQLGANQMFRARRRACREQAQLAGRAGTSPRGN